MRLMKGYLNLMKTSPILAALIAVLCLGVVSEAVKADSSQPMEEIPATLVRNDVVTQTVILPDGRKLEFVQFFPNANKEMVCLGNLGRKHYGGDYAELREFECFPAKTNPTPTMY